MKKPRKPSVQQRREFLRTSAATGAGAVIAAAVPGLAVAAAEVNVGQAARKDAGYQVTQHVIDYYKTCAR